MFLVSIVFPGTPKGVDGVGFHVYRVQYIDLLLSHFYSIFRPRDLISNVTYYDVYYGVHVGYFISPHHLVDHLATIFTETDSCNLSLRTNPQRGRDPSPTPEKRFAAAFKPHTAHACSGAENNKGFL